jgi:hypothetical protein
MENTQQLWATHGDSRPLVDKANDQWGRDHGGGKSGEASATVTDIRRKDGSVLPISLIHVESDPDGWWSEYAPTHHWSRMSPQDPGDLERLLGEKIEK